MKSLPYLLLLGRTPELSVLELNALVGQDVVLVTPQIAKTEFETDEEATAFFNKLGGSLKIMKVEGEFTDVSEEQLEDFVTAYIAQFPRPTFALAEIGRENIERIEITRIKRKLKERGMGSRFIEGDRTGLSASVLLHQDVLELNVIQAEEKLIFAKTVAVQDIDDWTKRDRSKPYADRKKGMLPPKVAREMVNIALGQTDTTKADPKTVIYDPFCGSSTVLMEAMVRGCDVIGSDIDQDAIFGSDANLKWFAHQYKSTSQFQVLKSDAAAVKPEQIGNKKVDCIVTEPFLGKPTPNSTQLPNIFKGLEKMYVGVFKHWTKLLKENGKVVIVFPFVQAGKQQYSLESIIDKLGTFGYNPILKPVLYHRPQAVVQRQIWVFEFKKP